MTQLSLFDLPTTSSIDNTAPSIVAAAPATYSVAAVAAKAEARPARRRRRRQKGGAPQANVAQGNVEGVQRMGDLARLVIRRYELAVKQRAALEAKQRTFAK